MKHLEQSSSSKQKVEQRLPVAGWRGDRQLPFDGCAVSEKQDENVLEKDGGYGSEHHKCTECHWIVHWKKWLRWLILHYVYFVTIKKTKGTGFSKFKKLQRNNLYFHEMFLEMKWKWENFSSRLERTQPCDLSPQSSSSRNWSGLPWALSPVALEPED